MATVFTPEQIKERINEWITTNGEGKITGEKVNIILTAMMSYIGVGFAFKGKAPAYAPSSDVPVIYIGGAGTYTAYSNEEIVVPDGSIVLFELNQDGAWSHDVFDVATGIVTSEHERAAAAEQALLEMISANVENLAAEVERATTKEGEMQQQINDNAGNIAAEVERATAAEQELHDMYSALTETPVVIGALPASGQPNTIYRVPGGSSYSDYMWDGTQFVLMATYSDGRLDFINVNMLNSTGGTPHAAYANAAAARADIAASSGLRVPGLHITYLLTDGIWYTDQFIGSDVSGWATAINWKTLGPVTVTQNTLTIGGESTGITKAFEINVNLLNNAPTTPYSFDDAAAAIPAEMRVLGLKMTYLSNNGWVTFQFMDTTTTDTHWKNNFYWKPIYENQYSPIITDEKKLPSGQGVNRRVLEVVNDILKELAFADIPPIKGRLDLTNNVIKLSTNPFSNTRDTFLVYKVATGDEVTILPNSTNGTAIALLSAFDFNFGDSYAPAFATGETGFRNLTESTTITISGNTIYLLVSRLINTTNKTPGTFTINGRDMMKGASVDYLIKRAQTLTDDEKAQVLSNLGLTIDDIPTENSQHLVKSGGVFSAINTAIQESGSRLDGSYKITITGTVTQGTILNLRSITERFAAGSKMKFQLTCDEGVISRYSLLSGNGYEMLKTAEDFRAWKPNTPYIAYLTNDTTYNDWGVYISAAEATGSGNITFEIWPYYYRTLEYLGGIKEFNNSDRPTTNYVLYRQLLARTSGYNVSAEFPTEGEGGGNTYTLYNAIRKVPSAQYVQGMTITFIDSETNEWVQWTKFKAGTWTDLTLWKRTDAVQGQGYSHPFNGKKLVTLCDSLGSKSQWQTLLASLTGAVYDASRNNDRYSVGGTQTLNNSNACGQERAKLLVNDGVITPDVIIVENVNDSAAPTGNMSDVAFFLNSREALSITEQESADAAAAYWNNNFASIVNGVTPLVGKALGLPYAISNAITLQITHVATANGNVDIKLSGMSDYNYIPVTTSDSIEDIVDKIVEFQWPGYNTVKVGTDTVKFSPESTGTKNIYVSYHSTHVTGTTQTAVSGTNYIWRYFYSRDVNDWTDSAKWVSSISRVAAWKGLVEYLFANFPNVMIYWLIPKTFSLNYEDSSFLRADGTINYDKVVTEKNYAASLFTQQIEFCNYYQIPYIDIRNESCITPANIATFIRPSNVHPKQEGYDRWAKVIAAKTA